MLEFSINCKSNKASISYQQKVKKVTSVQIVCNRSLPIFDELLCMQHNKIDISEKQL